ncbi:MAG: hypothetical protein RR191_00880 [Cetobacterium sp.]|uniref:hypothetical protein n=1 Tax=unclassified Cetobacterium TaxID=2630983 RepID=UPI00163C5F1F|nr:hypothetical protein [Cetobacterium sp. 2A]MBC2856518.1 hypothetical protein [Cetobacterium sp. 2A]
MDIVSIKVLKFLVSGKAYSDSAIIKNIGISEDELKKIYIELENNGYLESYDDFVKNNQSVATEKKSCGSGCGSSCSSKSSSGGCCSSKDEDYSNIKVLTLKAIKEFGDN